MHLASYTPVFCSMHLLILHEGSLLLIPNWNTGKLQGLGGFVKEPLSSTRHDVT